MAQETATLAAMKRAKAPLTLENYLHWAYLGNPPAKLDAEQEAELPEQFQRELEQQRQKASTKASEKA
jgi:hypothetical protein